MPFVGIINAFDFPLYGLDASWRMPRWLEFVDGIPSEDPWAIWLGHGEVDALHPTYPWVEVGSLPQPRHRAVMGAAGGDGAREVAFTTLFKLVNLTLPAPADRPSAADYLRRLVELVESEADDHAAWPQATWLVDGRTVNAHVFEWAGAWAGFTTELDDVAVVVLAAAIAADSMTLARVLDTQEYHFNATQPITFPEDLANSKATAFGHDGGSTAPVRATREGWWPRHADHARPMQR
jgi:hypothetical protein